MRMTPTGLTLDKIYFRILQMIARLERLIMSIAKKKQNMRVRTVMTTLRG